MNKTLINILIIVIALVGLIWFIRPEKENVSGVVNNGSLALDSVSYDFGSISMAAGKVSYQFKLKNTNSEAVTVKKIYTSCMCTTASLMLGDKKFGPYGMLGHGFVPTINQTIGAGQEAIIEVVFDPAAHGPAGVGKIERAITIENSAGKPLQFSVRANVTP